MAERLIQFDNFESVLGLFGSLDENVKIIEDAYNVTVISRGDTLKITGEPDSVDKAADVIDGLILLLGKGETLNEQNVHYVIDMVNSGSRGEFDKMISDCICITAHGKPIKAKTLGQRRYVDAIKNNTVIFGVGPAGTGKTYLAVAMAVKAFKAKEINRIILTRPAVEAGESLGFLPGDLQQKVDPYLRPLYDALFDMFGAESFQKQMERGTIEVAPLAYMRGRTLDDSFIILDEAQNTTPEQMKMFLTRIGFGSKAVITGDVTQIDLPRGVRSGLVEAQHVLSGVRGISMTYFTAADVVRHPLVARIVQAYAKADEQRQQETRERATKKE